MLPSGAGGLGLCGVFVEGGIDEAVVGEEDDDQGVGDYGAEE